MCFDLPSLELTGGIKAEWKLFILIDPEHYRQTPCDEF